MNLCGMVIGQAHFVTLCTVGWSDLAIFNIGHIFASQFFISSIPKNLQIWPQVLQSFNLQKITGT